MVLQFRHGVAVGVLVGVVVALVSTGALIEPAAERDAGAAEFEDVERTAPDALVAEPRSAKAYVGLGAWVDVFDADPAYTGGTPPAVTPDSVAAMADAGVETIYLQAARLDDRSPDGLIDQTVIAGFLSEAHEHGIRVVGWYLPKLGDLDADLARIRQILEHEVDGHRFDGVALDIEDTTTVVDAVERNARLVELSRRADQLAGAVPLGAIVLAPPLLEVVNDWYWPDFPWAELAPHYDVWLPMSYWTERTAASGLRDGYEYNATGTLRLRELLGDPAAAVHGIGGIGDAVDDDQLEAFARSLADTGSVGGSVYDWATLSEQSRATLAELFATGPAADLPGG